MKRAKPIGRVGRSPVIAVRVRAPLHKKIVKSAKISGRSMSEEMAVLLERGFELTDNSGDRVKALVVPMKIGIAKLEVDAGDTLVCKADIPLTAVQMNELRDRLRDQLPEEVKLLVVSDRISLKVMKRAS
jgi:hypothetical protein